MRYLFVPGADLAQPTLTIDGPDAHHLLNVLRMRAGETVTLLDNGGRAALAEVSDVGKRSIVMRILEPTACPPDPRVHITVAQALGKGDKFEQVVQHATEVGASSFIPLLTERTVVRIDSRDARSKTDRWSAIAKGAAEQAGRGRIPTVESPISLRSLCALFPSYGRVLLLHPAGGDNGTRRQGEGEKRRKGEEGKETSRQPGDPNLPVSLSPCLPLALSPCLLLVGPEGGFSAAEVEMAEGAGAVRTSLGPYTLRTETAALVAVTRILFEAEGG